MHPFFSQIKQIFNRFSFSILFLSFTVNAFAQVTVVVPSTKAVNANFGYHIAHDGYWLLVGAKSDTTAFGPSGAAYFYKYDVDNWELHQRVGPDIGADGDLFGISVSISGDYAVIAANGDDTQGINAGAAYVYKLVGDNWVQHQKLLPHVGTGFDEYGIGVSMKDSLMVVGAYSDKENGPFAGAAYIYSLVDGYWVEETKVLPDDGAADDKFGRSVHTDGSQVIICGVLNDDLGTNSGSAYIFIKENGAWVQEVKLLQPDGAENDRFGRSLGIGLEYAAVGSVLDDDNGSKSGSVIIFHKKASGWEFQQKITPDDGEADDFFGYALSLYKNHLVVSAHNDDDYGLNSGKAYLFHRTGTSWTQIDKFYASNPMEAENFGESVYIDGSWISIGAPYGHKGDLTTGNAEIFPAPVVMDIPVGEAAKYYVYPNPARDYIYIENNRAKVEEIIISNVRGQQQMKIDDLQEGQINIESLSAGIYFIKIHLGSDIYLRRFIKID